MDHPPPFPSDEKSPHVPPKDSKAVASSSSEAPPYTPAATHFASLSLHSYDKLRLLNFPANDVAVVRQAIQSHYPFGIQAERPNYGGSHEFKLNSYPWTGQGKDAVPSRILMRECLKVLWGLGWVLMGSVDLSKKDWDKDTLVFRKEDAPANVVRRDLEWVAMSFNQTDRMRLIGAPQSLIVAVRNLLSSRGDLKREEWKDQRLNAWEFKMNGNPWWSSGEETMRTRAMLLGLLETLEREGWALYASFDQSEGGGGNHVSETDSWYVVRERGWVRGMRVWHR